MPPPPSIVFVCPYRDRAQQRAFFQRHMVDTVLADLPPSSWSIWFIHQCDQRRFNRGAMKNLGVRIAQDLYPDAWRDITFVFNDVDTMPFTAGFFEYATRRGVAKHFFGFTFALGGIASITGYDFDRAGGFPNLWAWGYEDNTLQERCLAAGVQIDRSRFFPIFDKNIMQFPDGRTRELNRAEFDRYIARRVTDGMYDISGIRYHELLLQQVAAANTAAEAETMLLPGVRQFEVTAFTPSVPEPTAPDDVMTLRDGPGGSTIHPYLASLKHPVRSIFGDVMGGGGDAKKRKQLPVW